MPYVEGQLTFVDYLGYEPVMAMAKKGLFGGPYLTFNDFCAVLASLYESSAVLGRARSNKLSVIEKIIAAQYPMHGPEPIKDLRKDVKESLDEFIKERGREPHSFLEFIQIKQIENVLEHEGIRGLPDAAHGKLYADKAIGLKAIDAQAMGLSDKKVTKILMRKISLRDTEIGLRIYGNNGIAFGISFPELTENIYRNLHEKSKDAPVITLEQREKDILGIVADYIQQFWPELLDALDLRDYQIGGG